MLTTIYKLIEKYGRDKNYIFFRVSEHRYRTQISILAHYTNRKFYDYSYYAESHPVNLVSAMGISGIEAKFYRPFEPGSDDIDILANSDMKSVINDIVDTSFKQDETNDGRTVKFQSGVYAMLGSVQDEYYDITVTRTGFARVKACSWEEACNIANALSESDISWSDSWETDCYISDDQTEIK